MNIVHKRVHIGLHFCVFTNRACHVFYLYIYLGITVWCSDNFATNSIHCSVAVVI